MSTPARIAVLGAGSFGSAMAIHLARAGNFVHLWGHDPNTIKKMQQDRCNTRYLPGTNFPENLTLEIDLQVCLNTANYIIIAVPSHAFTTLLTQITTKPKGLAWLTKGIDPTSHKLLSDLVFERFGAKFPIGIIAGPSFAKEIALNLPTALVVASNDLSYAHSLQKLFHYNNLRVYLSNDIIGVQWCGAVKNILAIACGISDGLNYGANAKAALITRGLAEMSRLGTFLKAEQETFLGLAGVGDLVLTCTDNQSRNRRFGILLGQGNTPIDAVSQIGQVVEGMHNSAQICTISKTYNIDMPICNAVQDVLSGILTPEDAVISLMNRPPRNP